MYLMNSITLFFENLTTLGKLKFHYGLSGNRRTTIQLLRQLDGIELHLRPKTPSPPPNLPLLHQGSMSPPQCAPFFFPSLWPCVPS